MNLKALFRSKDPGTADSCPQACDLSPVAPPDGVNLIECRDVRFSYHDGVEAISGVGFDIAPGESVALCGPNGSGKTTLLKILAGLMRPDAGIVRLCGRELTPAEAAQAFRYIGILFQDPNDQLFCTHVSEDVAFGLVSLGLTPEDIGMRVRESLKLVEAEHLIHRPIHHLSLGEMKRVALAGLIAMRTPLLVLDEPTSGLDPAADRRLVKLIQHLNREHGYAFLIVTHEMDIVPQVAGRVMVISRGKLMADRDTRSVLTDMELLSGARLEPPAITKYFYEKANGEGISPRDLPLSIEEALTRRSP